MATTKQTAEPRDPVIERLEDGHYDRLLAEFDVQLQAAAAMLRRAHEAMKAENTLRS
jgi:hypothetical protein